MDRHQRADEQNYLAQNHGSYPGFPPEAKVAIPRLQRPPTSASTDRARVTRACESCRRRKSKCDGPSANHSTAGSGIPSCSRCKDQGLTCFYPDGKRERLKQSHKDHELRIKRYELLLEELAVQQPPDVQDMIRATLDDHFGGSDSGYEPTDDEGDDPIHMNSPAQRSHAPIFAGYPNRMGYLGRTSPVHWIHETGANMVMPDPQSTHFQQPVFQECLRAVNRTTSLDEFNQLLSESSCYFESLERVESRDFGGDPQIFILPSRQQADAFVEVYFTTIHPLLPILDEQEFTLQYTTYWETLNLPEEGYAWLSCLNIIFAIGALYSYSTESQWGSTDKDHISYFVKARACLEPTRLLTLPTMQHIRYCTLCTMYLAASCQINRAHSAIGHALRWAQAFGLHLNNARPISFDARQETEVRLWHSICSLERYLAFLTGRPSAISDRDNSTRQPYTSTSSLMGSTPTSNFQALPNASAQGSVTAAEPSRSSLNRMMTDPMQASGSTRALISGLSLDAIMAQIFTQLYGRSAIRFRGGTEVNKHRERIAAKLAHWRNELPDALLISQNNTGKRPIQERMFLHLRYHSLRMLIHRPCLLELSKPPSSQFSPIQPWSHDSARECVDAARDQMRLFPDSPNIQKLYQSTPWWCVLHYIVQAGVVIIMEIFLDCVHVPEGEKGDLLQDAEKVLRWLSVIQKTSYPARQAWLALSRLIKLALAKIGRDVRGYMLQYSPADIALPSGGPPLHYYGGGAEEVRYMPQNGPNQWQAGPAPAYGAYSTLQPPGPYMYTADTFHMGSAPGST